MATAAGAGEDGKAEAGFTAIRLKYGHKKCANKHPRLLAHSLT